MSNDSLLIYVPGDFEEIYGVEGDPDEPQAGLWDAILTCPKTVQGSSKKVKAYHVRPEFSEDLVRHHWVVYQEGPFMYERDMQFAKAFALENH